MSNLDTAQTNATDKVVNQPGSDSSTSQPLVNMASQSEVQSTFKNTNDTSAPSVVSDSGQMIFSNPYESSGGGNGAWNPGNWKDCEHGHGQGQGQLQETTGGSAASDASSGNQPATAASNLFNTQFPTSTDGSITPELIQSQINAMDTQIAQIAQELGLPAQQTTGTDTNAGNPTQQTTGTDTNAGNPAQQTTGTDTNAGNPAQQTTGTDTNAGNPTQQTTGTDTNAGNPTQQTTGTDTNAGNPTQQTTGTDTNAGNPTQQTTGTDTNAGNPTQETTGTDNSTTTTGTDTSTTATATGADTNAVKGTGGPAVPGQWTTENYNGMNYEVLLPQNYNPDQQYPVVMYLHQLDMGTDPTDETNEVTPWFNQLEQSNPSIVVMPLLDQTSDPSGDSLNFGGITSGDNPGELQAMSVLKHAMSEYSSDPARVYVTGASMGGQGADDMMVKYNAIDGTEGRVFAGAVTMAGGIFDYGYPNPDQSVINEMSNVPVWAVHGADDTEVPLNWDQSMAAALANDPTYHYTEVANTGHDVWDGPQGYSDPEYFNWLMQQQAPDPTTFQTQWASNIS